MTDDRPALRRLLVDSGALAPDQFDALLTGWTSGPAPTHLLAHGAVDRAGARMIEAALKGYARLTPSALRGLFASGDRGGAAPPRPPAFVPPILAPTPAEPAPPRLFAPFTEPTIAEVSTPRPSADSRCGFGRGGLSNRSLWDETRGGISATQVDGSRAGSEDGQHSTSGPGEG